MYDSLQTVKSNFSHLLFECEYLSEYKTEVLEISAAYSKDIYAGNSVSEF